MQKTNVLYSFFTWINIMNTPFAVSCFGCVFDITSFNLQHTHSFITSWFLKIFIHRLSQAIKNWGFLALCNFGKTIYYYPFLRKDFLDTFILSETPSFSEDKSLERINIFLIGSVVQWFSIYKQYPIFRLSTSII